jgi:hypothetical protein
LLRRRLKTDKSQKTDTGRSTSSSPLKKPKELYTRKSSRQLRTEHDDDDDYDDDDKYKSPKKKEPPMASKKDRRPVLSDPTSPILPDIASSPRRRSKKPKSFMLRDILD